MYKRCPKCGLQWQTRQELLTDPDIVLVGYQVNFKRLETGLILFNHRCKGTMALYAADFSDLYDGPIFTRRATGSDQCPGYCLHNDEFRLCPAECECAYVRSILQKIRKWPKGRTAVKAGGAA